VTEPTEITVDDHPLSAAINNLASAIAAANSPKPEKPECSWTSLEITKLIISTITPIVLLLLGIYVANSEHHAEALTNARLKSYDTIKEPLNRIHCFILDVGTWKEETPEKVIGYKRELDREMHEEKAIWSPETFDDYTAYIDGAAFHIFGGIGQDAQVRTTFEQKRTLPNWDQAWEAHLTGSTDPDYQQVYDHLYNSFMRDLTH
jgi:hypothetical protein